MNESLVSENGVVYAIRERWDIQGMLQISDQGTAAANQAAMTTEIDALEAAYAENDKDIGFYDDSDNLTSHFIDSSATRTGVRVIQPPSFPVGGGAEYSTFRTYQFQVEADHPFSGPALISWTEAVSFEGTGGPVWGFLQPINGFAQQQLFSERSTQLGYQRGRAVGNGVYPAVPGPMWPTAEHEEVRSIAYEVPPDNSKRRTVTWLYTFEAIGSLVGRPTAKSIN
jgi:hypothetical protein